MIKIINGVKKSIREISTWSKRDLGYFLLGCLLTFSPVVLAVAAAPVVAKKVTETIRETRVAVKEAKALAKEIRA